MRKSTKKGFTIVELVIVIAVIAILAAVLIPTFTGIIRKARESTDIQLVRSLNTAVATENALDGAEKNANIGEAVAAALDAGFDLGKIKASAKNNAIVWDSVNDVFCYYDDDEGEVVYIPDQEGQTKVTDDMKFWIISDHVDEKYATYLTEDYNGAKDITTTVSLHLGAAEGITSVSYTNTTEGPAKNLEFYTYSGVELKVNAPYDNVALYDYADSAIITAVANASFYLHGTVGYVEIAAGHFVAEATAKVNTLVAKATGVTIDTATLDIANIYAPAGVQVGALDGASAEVAEKIDTMNPTLLTDDQLNNIDSVVADLKEGATKFAGGSGTKDDPYLIGTAEHMANISGNYDTYAYYKVVAEKIDLTDFAGVDLNGNFDGNGVVFTHVTKRMFSTVGTCVATDTAPVVLSNFTVKNEGGFGIVMDCGTTNLTFKNIAVTGYSVQDWNAGLFLRYGTANVGDEQGFDYTVNFENCSSNAELFSSKNAYAAILVGHGYSGAGSATINLDAATDAAINATTLYYTGSDPKVQPFGHKYYCMGVKTVKVDGVEVANEKITEGVVRVETKNPGKLENGSYGITTEADTAKVVASLNFQYTLWEKDYADKIDLQSGVGGTIGDYITLEVSGAEAVTLLNSVTSVEIKTGSDEFTYTLENGKLTLYVGSSNQYIDGTVSLHVEQYTAGSGIAKYKGSMNIATKTKDAAWSIK